MARSAANYLVSARHLSLTGEGAGQDTRGACAPHFELHGYAYGTGGVTIR